MKSLRDVAQIQGITDSSISVVQLAGKLALQIPFSLQQLIGRGSYKIDQIIWDKWASLNYENGALGYPTTDTQSTSDGFARFNHFEHGSIYTYERNFNNEIIRHTHAVLDPICKKWGEFGYEQGFGYPIEDTATTDDGFGFFNQFRAYGENPKTVDNEIDHFIYYTSATGAHALWGWIYYKWLKFKSTLGYPTTDIQNVNKTKTYCKFQYGEIVIDYENKFDYVKDQNGKVIWDSLPKEISVSPSTITLYTGGSNDFVATVKNQDKEPNYGIEILWALSNTNVGTITPSARSNAKGEAISTFKALAAGTVTVTASTVTVNPPPPPSSASVTVNARPDGGGSGGGSPPPPPQKQEYIFCVLGPGSGAQQHEIKVYASSPAEADALLDAKLPGGTRAGWLVNPGKCIWRGPY